MSKNAENIISQLEFLGYKIEKKEHQDTKVKVEKNSFRMEPWYRSVDPWKHLKDYKIMEYMQETKSKPTDVT